MIENANGYFGVVVPNRGFVVSAYLVPELDEAAQQFLKSCRKEAENFPPVEVTVPIAESPDNQLIGQIGAAVVKGFIDQMPQTVLMAEALSTLIKSRFFWIESYPHGPGSFTNIGVMPDVTTVPQAMNFFKDIPVVKTILSIGSLFKRFGGQMPTMPTLEPYDYNPPYDKSKLN